MLHDALSQRGPVDRTPLRIAIVWLLMVPLVAFWLSQAKAPQSVSLAVLPVMPKAGEPAVATLRLNNFEPAGAQNRVSFYVDGELLVSGTSWLAGNTAKSLHFVRLQPMEIGQRTSFGTMVETPQGVAEEVRALPEYPPAVLSSFVSFAASSSTVMSSLVNMSYYRTSFTSGMVDAGLVMILAMLAMSILAEISQAAPAQVSNRLAAVRRLVHRSRLVLVTLYIIFGGIAITKLGLLFGLL